MATRKKTSKTKTVDPKPVNRGPARISRRAYDAGKINRLFADWMTTGHAANVDIKQALVTSRNRARDLEQNDDICRRYLALVETNIVGKAGFTLRLKGDNQDEIAQIRERFTEWLDECEVTGQFSGPELQRLAVRTWARDGEGLGLFYRGREYKHGLAFRALEPDYLDEQSNHKGWRVIMGVHLDPVGRPIKYDIYNRHPGEVTDVTRAATNTYDARDVLHLFRPERAGQVRGMTWLSSIMKSVRMLHGYQEAELVAARVASCQMGFYKIPPGEDWKNDGEDADGSALSDAAPGVFERMPTGWEFQSFSPTHPTSQYGAFVKEIKREISSGVNVSYGALANDGSDANYSSMREMSILERENWLVCQDSFARRFMRRLYREWIQTAELSNLFNFDVAPYRQADSWTGRTWPWVDPEKDINARKIEIELGLTSPSILAAERGIDYGEVLKQIAEDEKKRKENNLPSLFVTAGKE